MGDNGHDTTAVKSPRLRWWQDPRWIASGVIAATIVFLLWGLFGPEAAIRVSRETTYLTEPLAADGLPRLPRGAARDGWPRTAAGGERSGRAAPGVLADAD